MKKRTNIPKKIEGEVMFKSDRQCCVCKGKGHQIHHLNFDATDHRFDNLVLLCIDCHNDAGVKDNIIKKLSAETIINYRDHHYAVVETQRKKALGVLDSKVNDGLTEEDLLTASLSASIIVEIINLKDEFYRETDDEKQAEVLMKLHKYEDHVNYRVRYEVLLFLEQIADNTRAGSNEKTIDALFWVILGYFPNPRMEDEHEQKQFVEMAKMGMHIGFSIVYDSLIYLNHYGIAVRGLTILKHMYNMSKRSGIKSIEDEVFKTYDEIEGHLGSRHENLEEAKELVKIFKEDIDTPSLSYPPLPSHLSKKAY